MAKTNKPKISIKTRILVSILTLIFFIFFSVILTFNLLVNAYIKRSATEELKHSIKAVQNERQQPDLYSSFSSERIDQNADFQGISAQIKEKIKAAERESDTEVMIVSSDYNLVLPEKDRNRLEDIQQYEELLEAMKNYQVDLNSNEIFRVVSGKRHYYGASINIKTQGEGENSYLVLFIDISNTLDLEKQINMMLALVMCTASVLALFTAVILARRIASPIQQLCRFAKNLGENNFGQCCVDFADKELDELSQIMNRSAQQLDKYDKEQKVFFQNVSHELRTPLMSIKGYAEAIKYDVINKEDASQIILEESDRLSTMVEELLYISKMDNITKDYKISQWDLRELLSNCIVKQKVKALNKGVAFKYDFDQQPVWLRCDERSMTRAFLNLIENGLRYASSQLTVGCRNEGKHILVYIEDDGEGIKGKDLPHIFERFYKGENGKHGIGLSIVQSIIKEHKGEIYAENGCQGARFTILFMDDKA